MSEIRDAIDELRDDDISSYFEAAIQEALQDLSDACQYTSQPFSYYSVERIALNHADNAITHIQKILPLDEDD